MIQRHSFKQTKKIQPSADTKIFEYLVKCKQGSVAVAEINGRYPARGFVKNLECVEFAYILTGKGYLLTRNKKFLIKSGDLLVIPNGDLFAWQGKIKILIFCTPPYDNIKHVQVKLKDETR